MPRLGHLVEPAPVHQALGRPVDELLSELAALADEERYLPATWSTTPSTGSTTSTHRSGAWWR